MNALFYLHPELLAKAMYEDEPETFHREYLCEFTKPKTFDLGELVIWTRKCNGDRLPCEINSPVRSDGRVVVEFFKTDGTPYRRTVYVEDINIP